MSTATTGPRTAARGRVFALARGELTLLARNKAALTYALVLPGMLTYTMKSAVEGVDLKGTGLDLGTMLLPGSIGMALVLAVYMNLVGVYVIRREDLVLKRLRAGEPTDAEILSGSALPAVLLGLVQCVLLVGGVSVALDVSAPKAPYLAVVGVAAGVVQMVMLAAATAAFTRTSESAQLTPVPMMMISIAGSGLFVPLEVMPDQIASLCEMLPLTPVVDLVRAGWTGDMGVVDALGTLATALAWTVLAWWAVRKRFRWEPRR